MRRFFCRSSAGPSLFAIVAIFLRRPEALQMPAQLPNLALHLCKARKNVEGKND